MKAFKKAAIIGTGLIGGSIALGLKKKKLAKEIVGVSRHKASLLLAKKIGAIDKGSLGLGIIKDADLVILAAPVGVIIELAPKISKIISKNALVFDVGSTKYEIVARLSEIFPNFIGTHPLAGSEKRGIANADGNIFKNSLCILTPSKNTNLLALTKVKKIWTALGAKVCSLPAGRHDEVLAFVSHLPHIIAFSLINAIPAKFLKFASTGLKSTTRIASSDTFLWSDIFLSNRGNVIKSIKSAEYNLFNLKQAIIRNDRIALEKILKQAKIKRDSLG